jgi:ribosomal protein S27AE
MDEGSGPGNERGSTDGDGDGGDGDGRTDTGDPGGSGDVDGDGGDLAARVADLERTVDRLRERLAARERDHALLAAKVDVEAVSPTCPDCGEGTLRTTSGLTWTRAECPECGTGWYL